MRKLCLPGVYLVSAGFVSLYLVSRICFAATKFANSKSESVPSWNLDGPEPMPSSGTHEKCSLLSAFFLEFFGFFFGIFLALRFWPAIKIARSYVAGCRGLLATLLASSTSLTFHLHAYQTPAPPASSSGLPFLPSLSTRSPSNRCLPLASFSRAFLEFFVSCVYLLSHVKVL